MTKAEKTKQHIIEQSAELFNQNGFSGTSLNDILKATGLSKGGLYGHFRNGKAEIAVAAFDHAISTVYQEIGTRTHQLTKSADKLKAVVHFYRNNIFTSPVKGGCPLQNTTVDADHCNPELKERVKEVVQDWKGRIIHTLNKGIEYGEFREDIDKERFAKFFIAGIEGGILIARTQNDAAEFDAMGDVLIEKIDALCK